LSGVCFSELIKKLLVVVKEKCQEKLHQDVLLHHDNAPGHTRTTVMAAIRE